MSLTKQQAFRLGFLLRCAEEGCDAAEVNQRVDIAMTKIAARQKQALNPVKETVDTVTSVANPLTSLAKMLFMAPIHLSALGIAGSGLAGAGVGYGLARMQNNNVDPAEVKRQELTNAYRVQADALLRRTSRRMNQQPV